MFGTAAPPPPEWLFWGASVHPPMQRILGPNSGATCSVIPPFPSQTIVLSSGGAIRPIPQRPRGSVTFSGLLRAYLNSSSTSPALRLATGTAALSRKLIGSACVYRPHPALNHLKMLYRSSVPSHLPTYSCPGKRSS